MKYLILFLVSFSVYAFEVWEGQTATLSCTEIDGYESGDPLRADDIITYKLYRDNVEIAQQMTCSFGLDSNVAGSFVYHVTAHSSFYNNESIPSNTAPVNVQVKQRPKSPAGITVTLN